MCNHNAPYYLQRLPVFSAVFAALLSGFVLFFDIPNVIKVTYELSVVTYGFWLIHKFARVLHLCLVVKSGIYYTYCFFLCLWLRRYPDGDAGIFGQYLRIVQIVIFAIGCCYVALLIHKHRRGQLPC